MNKTIKFILGIAIILSILIMAAGYTHILLPSESDDCQQDISHRGHINELPAYHCLGHSEWDYDRDTWDHLHPWMDSTWHVENGYDPIHVQKSKHTMVK